jgi:hypothetical protein
MIWKLLIVSEFIFESGPLALESVKLSHQSKWRSLLKQVQKEVFSSCLRALPHIYTTALLYARLRSILFLPCQICSLSSS